ncbi:hypothetical protein CJ307_35715, partial [Klebsiella quasipneumoniae]
ISRGSSNDGVFVALAKQPLTASWRKLWETRDAAFICISRGSSNDGVFVALAKQPLTASWRKLWETRDAA